MAKVPPDWKPALPLMEQDEREFAALLVLLQGAQPPIRSVLEVGVFQGGTLARFMEALPDATVVGIDPRPMIRGWGTVVPGCSQDPDVRQRARSYNDGEHFEFVFIDGDHSYDGVREDWEWAKQTSRVVAFHDIRSAVSCPDVVRFWRDLTDTGDYDHAHEIADHDNANGIGVVWP